MISDMPQVPSGWEKVKFGQIAKNITDRVDNPRESGLDNYIGLEHLDTDEIRIKRYGSPTEVEATKFLCKKGDIIFGKRRAYLRKLAVSSRDAIVSAHSMVLRAKEEKVDPDFLPWFMQSSQFWKTAFAISEGSLSPTIKWKTLSTQEFWLPSKQEQKKIAKILWTIENDIEKNENLVQVVEKLKKELLDELLTKGIKHTKFRNVRFNLESFEVPEDWLCLSIQELIDKGWIFPNQDGNHGELHPKSCDYVIDGVPFLTANDIFNFEIKFENTDKILKSKADSLRIPPAKKDDVLITHKGTLGRVAIIPQNEFGDIVLSPQVTFYRIKNSNKLTKEYLFYFFQTSVFKRMFEISGQQSTRGFTSITNQRKLKILMPSNFDEQNKINDILLCIDLQLMESKKHLTNLQLFKKKLLNELILGNLTISEVSHYVQ